VKKVILFGAGTYGKVFLEKNDDLIQDNFLFCDNDPGKIGKVNGLRIVSFCEMKQLYEKKKITRIILTTVRAMEILEQLVENAISIDDVYFYDMPSNAIRPVKDIYSQTVFSQEGEELYLREKFAQREDGVYVDVGALSPFRYSNTAWAYERGWRGINIELNLEQFHLFEIFRPEDININCGIADQEREMIYYCFEEPGLNGFDVEAHKNIPIIDKRKVVVRKLSDILKEYKVKRVDFLDIDVEGFELEVLRSINFSVDIECILLEQHVDVELLKETKEYVFLKEQGYKAIAKYGRTTVYEKQ